MIHIVELWCSPLREEVYRQNVITLSTADYCAGYDDDLNDYINSYVSDMWYDLFGENYLEIGGLWKVVFGVRISYHLYHDWEGIPDTDVQIKVDQVMLKTKCSSLSELKYIWLELNGRTEEHYRKVQPECYLDIEW